MMSQSRLAGKVAIVTGGAQGIGLAIGHRLAADGAKIVVADLSLDAATVAAEQINRNGVDTKAAIPIQADVSSKPSVDAMVGTVMERFGRIDVLVNNAALWKGLPRRPFWEVPTDEWDKVFAVNTRGVFLCCAAVAPIMIKQNSGKIIMIGSSTIGTAQAELTHYTTSKAALIGLTRCIARELGRSNICVNLVHPGLTDTGGVPRERLEDRAKNKFIKRVGMPEDLTGTVSFLASEDSSFITAQQIYIDGGGILN